jgi:hypothetical protein
MSFLSAVFFHGLLNHLTACDYFLWGYIQVKVFINKPCIVHELKVATEHEIVAIPADMARYAMSNFKTRLQECVRRDGKHLDGIIFKTK